MKKNKKGFTLAEIIISMTIIGVIAAITIPALLTSTSEKTLEAQRKAVYARMAQSISQIEDLRVFGKTNLIEADEENDIEEHLEDSSSAMNFITSGLSKVYRITKICDKSSITLDCRFPTEALTQTDTPFKLEENQTLVTYIDNSSVSAATFGGIDTEVAGFMTANGESFILYYNPKCRGEKTNGFYSGSITTAMCLNMIYDLNGKDNAPNQVGKDIGFITVFFPKDPDAVSPNTYEKDTTSTSGAITNYSIAIDACKNENSALILPNWEEGMAIAINKKLTGVEAGKYIVTGIGSTGTYLTNVETLASSSSTVSSSNLLRCIYNK